MFDSFSRLDTYHRTLLGHVLREELSHEVSNYEASDNAANQGTNTERHKYFWVIARHDKLLVLAVGFKLKHALFVVFANLLSHVCLEAWLVLFCFFVPHFFVDSVPDHLLAVPIMIFASVFTVLVFCLLIAWSYWIWRFIIIFFIGCVISDRCCLILVFSFNYILRFKIDGDTCIHGQFLLKSIFDNW